MVHSQSALRRGNDWTELPHLHRTSDPTGTSFPTSRLSLEYDSISETRKEGSPRAVLRCSFSLSIELLVLLSSKGSWHVLH